MADGLIAAQEQVIKDQQGQIDVQSEQLKLAYDELQKREAWYKNPIYAGVLGLITGILVAK
jgi:hypothetical protein